MNNIQSAGDIVPLLNETGTGVGPLFRDISDSHLQICFAEKIWDHIKELMITSSDLICHEIDSDIMFHLLDIVEEAIVNQIQFFPAKL